MALGGTARQSNHLHPEEGSVCKRVRFYHATLRYVSLLPRLGINGVVSLLSSARGSVYVNKNFVTMTQIAVTSGPPLDITRSV